MCNLFLSFVHETLSDQYFVVYYFTAGNESMLTFSKSSNRNAFLRQSPDIFVDWMKWNILNSRLKDDRFRWTGSQRKVNGVHLLQSGSNSKVFYAMFYSDQYTLES